MYVCVEEERECVRVKGILCGCVWNEREGNKKRRKKGKGKRKDGVVNEGEKDGRKEKKGQITYLCGKKKKSYKKFRKKYAIHN
jgi:hypothetical protein